MKVGDEVRINRGKIKYKIAEVKGGYFTLTPKPKHVCCNYWLESELKAWNPSQS